jgi:hypothetical protein
VSTIGDPTIVPPLRADHLLPTRPPCLSCDRRKGRRGAWPNQGTEPNILPDTTPAKCCTAGGGPTILLGGTAAALGETGLLTSPCFRPPALVPPATAAVPVPTRSLSRSQPTAANPTTRGAQPNQLGEPQHLAETASAKCCAAISARPFFRDGTAAALGETGLLTSPCFRPPALVPPATAAVPVATRPADWYARPTQILVQGRWPDHCPVSTTALAASQSTAALLLNRWGASPADILSFLIPA